MSTSHTRSQVSVEIILSFSLFMLFAGIMLLIYVNKNMELNDRIFLLAAQSIVDNLVLTVNTAILEGDGFSTMVELPDAILGSPYTVFFSGNWVYLNITRNSILASKPVLNSNVTGTPGMAST